MWVGVVCWTRSQQWKLLVKTGASRICRQWCKSVEEPALWRQNPWPWSQMLGKCVSNFLGGNCCLFCGGSLGGIGVGELVVGPGIWLPVSCGNAPQFWKQDTILLPDELTFTWTPIHKITWTAECETAISPAVLETKAGPLVWDRQLLVWTSNFLRISLQINVWISQNNDQDRQLFQLSPEHWSPVMSWTKPSTLHDNESNVKLPSVNPLWSSDALRRRQHVV